MCEIMKMSAHSLGNPLTNLWPLVLAAQSRGPEGARSENKIAGTRSARGR